MTIIYQNTKIVWNGSLLTKELSSNTFNNYWKHNIKPDVKKSVELQPKISTSNDADIPAEEPHHLFYFLNVFRKVNS